MKLVYIIGTCIAFIGVTLGQSQSQAQTGVIPPSNLSAPAPNRSLPEAPVGHRQPRAAELPQTQAEPGSLRATEDENARQDAALDRKIKGICKGC